MADPRTQVDRAIEVLLAGGVIVVPTDTVYGLAARVDDAAAVGRLYELKGRPDHVPIAVLVADVAQADELGRLSDADRAVADHFWPGPLTVVVPARRELSFAAADGTVGLRCPESPLVRTLAAGVGPLATTSANRHGAATPLGAAAAAAGLAGPVDLVVDGGPCAGAPSTVVTVGPPTVVHRPGPVTADAIGTLLA